MLLLNQEPNYDYLGHPVNSYHFIRHMATGWPSVMAYVRTAMKHPGINVGYSTCDMNLYLKFHHVYLYFYVS